MQCAGLHFSRSTAHKTTTTCLPCIRTHALDAQKQSGMLPDAARSNELCTVRASSWSHPLPAFLCRRHSRRACMMEFMRCRRGIQQLRVLCQMIIRGILFRVIISLACFSDSQQRGRSFKLHGMQVTGPSHGNICPTHSTVSLKCSSTHRNIVEEEERN